MTRLLIAVAIVLAACNPMATPTPAPPPAAYHPSPPAHRGGTAVLGAFSAPDTLNPLAAGTESGLRVSALAFSPLWGLDTGLRPYPDLVDRVPTPANGGVQVAGGAMTIDVRLVAGLRWSDGAPITSDDVIFTWRALNNPATGAQPVPGVERVTAIDRRSDTETIWHLSRPYAGYLLLGPAMALLPEHRLSSLPPAEWARSGYFQRPDVVSGPFEVAESVPDRQIVLAANPRYPDGRSRARAYRESAPFTHAAYLDRIVYRVFPSKDALLQAAAGGAVDAAFGLGPEDVGTVGGYAGMRPDVHTGLRDEFLNPNHDVNTATGKPPPWAGDPAVLEALSLAVDRDALVSGPLRGQARVSRGLYPAPLAAWGDPATRLVTDPAAARKRLDTDGWQPRADGVRVKNGRPLQFSLFAVCPTAVNAALLDALRRQWAAVGASVQTECRGRGLFFARLADGGTNATGAFDMTLYSNAWAPDPAAWAPVGRSDAVPSAAAPGGLNWNRCRDAGLDADLARVDSDTSAGRRAAARAAERDWLAYGCTIPLLEVPDVRALAGRLHEVTTNPGMAAETWNASDWWLSA